MGQTIKSGVGALSLGTPSSTVNENGTTFTPETVISCVSNSCSTISPDVVASDRLCDTSVVIHNSKEAVHPDLPIAHVDHSSEELHIKPHNNLKSNTSPLEESLPAPIFSQPNRYHPCPLSSPGLVANDTVGNPVHSNRPEQCIESKISEQSGFSHNKPQAGFHHHNGINSGQEQNLPNLAPVYSIHKHSQHSPLCGPEDVAYNVYPHPAGSNHDNMYSTKSCGMEGKAEERHIFVHSDGVHSIVPYDPNLKCQFCQLCFRKGEIQLYKHHSQICASMQRN